MHAVFRQAAALCVCAVVLAGCASADEQKQTQAVFDTGVAAYDAKDYAKAFAIFSSIDDRDVAAMRNVALMLRKGVGTAKDPKAAEAMYGRAAQGGLATAAADLGEMLLNGEAGPSDSWKAAVLPGSRVLRARAIPLPPSSSARCSRPATAWRRISRRGARALQERRGRWRDGRGEAAPRCPAPGRHRPRRTCKP